MLDGRHAELFANATGQHHDGAISGDESKDVDDLHSLAIRQAKIHQQAVEFGVGQLLYSVAERRYPLNFVVVLHFAEH